MSVRLFVLHLDLVDTVRRTSSQLSVDSMAFHGIVATEPDGSQLLCVIWQDETTSTCHVLRLGSETATQQLMASLDKVVRFVHNRRVPRGNN